MKKKKQFDLGTITGTCVDYSHDGKGVVKTEGKPVFVDGLIIGEEAEIKMTFETSQLIYGKIVKLNKISPNRIKPVCPVSSACGGCCFHHLVYNEQLAFKKRKVEEAFRKIARLKVTVDDTIGTANCYNYRNKIQMPLGLNQKKEIISGFYRTKSHEIVPIQSCNIEDERAAEIVTALKQLMKKHKIPVYDEDRHEGVVRHVLVRTSHYLPQVMVVLVTNCDSFPGRNNLVKDLHKTCPKITTIVQNINTMDSNVILGGKENILMGRGYIEDKLCGVRFQISARSFYQVNSVQTEKLYSLAIAKAELKAGDTILDAYCGIGTISLIASKYVKKVIGVEIVQDAIRDAIANARLNEIKNAQFFTRDASELMVELAEENTKLDVVFIDPPRKGADEKFLQNLLLLAPQKIVYISCEPATLARDVEILSAKYNIKSITPVDMFPMTFHVETVVVLDKKNNVAKNM